MPKYNESNIAGETWRRAFEIFCRNDYEGLQGIEYREEDIFVLADGRPISDRRGERVGEVFTPRNATTTFKIRNPLTEEYTTQTATYQDVFVLLHSLYFYLAERRDGGSPPYLSWVWSQDLKEWQAPVPKPNDGKEYAWRESDQTWQERPYPSWNWNGYVWNPPVEKPDDGNEYTWNEETKSWDLVTP